MKVEGRVTLAPPGTARHTVPVSCREGRCALAAQLPSADGNPRGAPRYRTRGRAASAAPWGFLGPRCGPRNDIKWGRASAMSSTPIGLAIPKEPRAAPASLVIPSEPRAAASKEAEGGSRGERHLHPLAPPARAGVRWQRSCQVQVGIPEARHRFGNLGRDVRPAGLQPSHPRCANREWYRGFLGPLCGPRNDIRGGKGPERLAPSPSPGNVAKAAHHVVVDDADGLHEGVADRRPDETKAPLAQRQRHRVRLRAVGGDLVPAAVGLPQKRLTAGERPQEVAERLADILHRQEGPGVADGGFHLLAVADDLRVAQQAGDVARSVTGDTFRVESVEGAPEGLP